MIALHRGNFSKEREEVSLRFHRYLAGVRPVTNFILYSKMVYSASLRLAVSRGNPPRKAFPGYPA